MKIDALTKFIGSIAPAKKETPKESKRESKRTEKDKRDKRETREEKERAKRETREEKERAKRETREEEKDEDAPPAPEVAKGKPYLNSITMSPFNINFSGTRYPRARR